MVTNLYIQAVVLRRTLLKQTLDNSGSELLQPPGVTIHKIRHDFKNNSICMDGLLNTPETVLPGPDVVPIEVNKQILANQYHLPDHLRSPKRLLAICAIF